MAFKVEQGEHPAQDRKNNMKNYRENAELEAVTGKGPIPTLRERSQSRRKTAVP